MFAKKLIFIFLFSSFLFLASIFSSPIFAQTTAASNSTGIDFMNIQNAGKKGQTTLERWSEDSITGSSMAILKNMIGEVPEDFFTQLEQVTTTGQGKFPKLAIGGALGKGTQMIATLFTPPASGIQYIADTWGNVLGKPAYAQGYGFNGLQFLLPLWKAARNIVYLLSSIVFVVIGLMIILRVKISPQAVVTIQSAVPTVITSLILVTFSYAIAGLLIDIGNIVLGIILSAIFNAQGKGLSDNIINNTIYPFDFKSLSNPTMFTLTTLSFASINSLVPLVLIIGLISSVIVGLMTLSIGSGIILGVLGMLIILILFILIIGYWLVMLWFGLVKTYITIILKVISAPIEIFMGTFPNSKIGFSSWLLDILANIMVFPIVTIFLVILTIITDSILNTNGTIWAPGLISIYKTLYPPMLSAAVGLGGLALISKLPELIPQYIFMIKPSPFGAAIGENLATKNLPGVGLIKSVGSEALGTGIKSIITPTGEKLGQNLKNKIWPPSKVTLKNDGANSGGIS